MTGAKVAGLRRVLPLLLAATAIAALLGAAPTASARTRTFVLQSRTFHLGGFNTIRPKVPVRTPHRSGFIVGFNARLVYRNGRSVPLQRVMLHHIVFLNRNHFRRSSCEGRNSEPFWGSGEEHQKLILPRGYGYPVNATDPWRMQLMLMSHSLRSERVRVEYRVRMVLGRRLQPVKPLWLRANGCTRHPSYDVNGEGGPGSVHRRSAEWKIPVNGRIVAAGAHLHGSSYGMTVSQPECGDRTLFRHDPLYGQPNDVVYRIRPILHEPGPVATGYWLSRQGIRVHRGETIKVTGLYDDSRPHPAVMAISHIYIAVGRISRRACPPLPSDGHIHWTRQDGRRDPPLVTVPLNRLMPDGIVREIDRPPGAQRVANDFGTVSVGDRGFGPANLSIARGGSVLFRWIGTEEHNIYLANGPRNVAIGIRRDGEVLKKFDTPGTYRMFCTLHPVTMQEVVDVRP